MVIKMHFGTEEINEFGPNNDKKKMREGLMDGQTDVMPDSLIETHRHI